MRLARSKVIDKDVLIAVDIRGPGQAFAVRRKLSCIDLPFVRGKPCDLLAGDIQKSALA